MLTMKSLSTKGGNEGFSLIELMTVVAIIGILSAVAVPQYAKFQNKARQSEAKVALGAVLSVEKAYFAEQNSYSTCLVGIGMSAPDGARRYTTGFGANGSFMNGMTSANCTAGANVTYHSATSPFTVTTPASTFTADATTFSAASAGTLAAVDRWTINQTGTLANPNNGL